MSIPYEYSIVVGSEHWTNQWLSFGKVHNNPDRLFCMRTHKPNHWGGDEKFVLRGVSQYDAEGKGIAFRSGNICYGDDLYLYSVSHSIYMISTPAPSWARFAKKENDRISLISVANPSDRGEVGLGDELAICHYSATDGIRVDYLTYDNSEDGLMFDKDEIQAYERWQIQSY